MRLTKKQLKDQDRVLAWLSGSEFRENRRAKPGVPQLSIEEVIEQYVPSDIKRAARYYTPLEMAKELCAFAPVDSDTKILDPCAGIGNLLYPLRDRHATLGFQVDAFELEELAVKVGRRLYPRVNWKCAIPFNHFKQLERQYDYVLMNPPFGVQSGLDSGWEMCERRCRKSEHVFLELAIRALKPNGLALVLGVWNLIDGLPKKARVWFKQHAIVEHVTEDLPGEFRFAKIPVQLFVIRRLEEEEVLSI